MSLQVSRVVDLARDPGSQGILANPTTGRQRILANSTTHLDSALLIQ